MNLLNQFRAQITKRFIHTSRNKSLILSQLVFPAVLLVINLAFIKYGPIKYGDSPALPISLNKYSDNFVPLTFYNDDNSTKKFDYLNSLLNHYRNQLLKYPNVKAFNLNETANIHFCLNARNSIEQYLSCLGRFSHRRLVAEHFVAVDFSYTDFIYGRQRSKSSLKVTGHFNNQLYHIPPLTLSLITNALLKHYSNNSESTINVINHPLPRNMSDVINEITKKDIVSFLLSSGLTFGLSFLISSFSLFLIKERVSGAKHLQMLNGGNSFIFWLSAFCWDVLNYLIPVFFIIGILFVR